MTPANVLAPIGRIEPSLFQGEASADVTTRIQAYLDDADTRLADVMGGAPRDRAQVLWAEYRSYDAAYTMRLSDAASETTDGVGTTSFTTEQFKGLRTLRDDALASYEALFISLTATDTATVTPPSGVQRVRVKMTW